MGQGLAFPLGVLGASRVRGGPYQGAPARAGLETYLRDLQGSAGVGNCLRSSLVTLVFVVFAPVAILVLSCLYRSHNP